MKLFRKRNENKESKPQTLPKPKSHGINPSPIKPVDKKTPDIILPDTKSPQKADKPTTCGNCGASIGLRDFCILCGWRRGEMVMYVSTKTEESIVCGGCESIIPPWRDYCIVCGWKKGDPPQIPNTSTQCGNCGTFIGQRNFCILCGWERTD